MPLVNRQRMSQSESRHENTEAPSSHEQSQLIARHGGAASPNRRRPRSGNWGIQNSPRQIAERQSCHAPDE
jgi:hypothetical protein